MLPDRSGQYMVLPDNTTILVKIPEDVYQSWWHAAYDWADLGIPVERRQRKTFELLTKWIEKNYPNYGLVAFEDYNAGEAATVSRKTGKHITWGMYVLLQIGGSMQPISITDKLIGL